MNRGKFALRVRKHFAGDGEFNSSLCYGMPWWPQFAPDPLIIFVPVTLMAASQERNIFLPWMILNSLTPDGYVLHSVYWGQWSALHALNMLGQLHCPPKVGWDDECFWTLHTWMYDALASLIKGNIGLPRTKAKRRLFLLQGALQCLERSLADKSSIEVVMPSGMAWLTWHFDVHMVFTLRIFPYITTMCFVGLNPSHCACFSGQWVICLNRSVSKIWIRSFTIFKAHYLCCPNKPPAGARASHPNAYCTAAVSLFGITALGHGPSSSRWLLSYFYLPMLSWAVDLRAVVLQQAWLLICSGHMVLCLVLFCFLCRCVSSEGRTMTSGWSTPCYNTAMMIYHVLMCMKWSTCRINHLMQSFQATVNIWWAIG